ncbi:MAG: hypothetical protein Q7S58_13170 [Candidatus Binatus sp.]|uniref:hypothetical protein n=1 Tax=Candidatus Binatus sp. TaxID=2811406 RepID=UPI002727CAEA|nr:hypothetical protein [Candidatus Binatus sp.]MDO8433350.1 hypothetical protein [Candidatus Binatus sp.]
MQKGRRTFARGPQEIGFVMDYKTGAQAGASTCQRHQPVLIFRLEKFIVATNIHIARRAVNQGRSRVMR